MKIHTSSEAQLSILINSVVSDLKEDFTETLKELITEIYRDDKQKIKSKVIAIRYVNAVLLYFNSRLTCFDIEYDTTEMCLVLNVRPRSSGPSRSFLT